jgi:hypothetical protein
MSRHLLLSTAALALVLAAHPAGAQSTSPAGTQKQQTQQAPAAQAPAQQSQQPSSQQTTQQPAPTTQQNAQQPRTNTQQTTQQPAPSTQQNAQQPATGTQRQPQQTTQQPATGTQQKAQQPATRTQQQQQTTQEPATGSQQQRTTQQPSTGTQQKAQQPATGTQTKQQTTQGGAASTGASVSLNTQQRTQISSVVARTNVEPLRNVNFAISVGTVVPNTVRLHPLPADIVTIVPQYRGYSYVVVEEEIVIIEPRSHRIVAVLPYEGGRKGAATRSSRKVELSREDRDRVRRHATQSRRSETTGTTMRRSRSYEVGEEVPDSVTVERFTETYEVPTVRRYRYFTEGDDVILVDPDEDRVIEIIR